MACCSIASLSVGYIYLSCFHLHSFASSDQGLSVSLRRFPLKGKALCEFELHGKQSFGQNSWYTTIVYVMAQWSPGLWFEHIHIDLNHCLTLIAWLKATISVSVCTLF